MPTAQHPEIRQAEEALRQAMLANDVAALALLLHDDLSFAGPDGTLATKADDLAAHAACRLRLTRLELEETDIRPEGEGTVRVVAKARLAGTFDGAVCDGLYEYVREWRMADGRWQIVGGSVRAL